MSKNSNTDLKTIFNRIWAKTKDISKKVFNGFLHAKTFWVAFAILIILFIISIVVLSIQLYDFVKIDDRSVSLRSSMDESLNVFAMEYENDKGEITIKGQNGEKVIAPGTNVEYTLRFRNTDDIALDYTFVPEVSFSSEHKLPVLVRLLDSNDEYVIGNETTWVPIDKIEAVEHKATLLENETAEYVFQWKWPYESGDDEHDSFLGSAEAGDVSISLALAIHATPNTNVKANGGFFASPIGKLVVLIIIVILLAIAIALLLIYIINKRREKRGEDPIVIEVPVVTPVVEAISRVVMPNAAKYTAQGKVHYVNLNQLGDFFHSGDRVTIENLKQKGLVPKNAKRMKILARDSYTLDKALIIETQAISANAKKAVIEAGGRVVIVDPNTKEDKKQ